ncbi:MAG: hypothetical protein R3C32_13575 [Chloroflexota bacterium]
MELMWPLAVAAILAVLAVVAEALGADPGDDQGQRSRPMTPGGT